MNTDLREDLLSYVRLMNICIHYKLGNESLMENLIQSTTCFLQKRSWYNALESSFLIFAKTYLTDSNSSKSKMIENLKTIEAVCDTDNAKATLSSFDFVSWLRSCVENKTMEEIMREKINF